MAKRIFALTLALIAAACEAAGAEPALREFRAARAAKPPVLDGKLDDECWTRAEPLTGFLRIDSATPASAQTTGYVVYDDDHIYIAAKCLEPDTKNILAPVRPHDNAYIFGQDAVDVLLDPACSGTDATLRSSASLRSTSAYQFVVNAGGSTYDAFIHKGGLVQDRGWNGEWQAKGFVGEGFWSVEIAIPFATLGLTSKTGPVWGFNICRHKSNPRELSSLGVTGGFYDGKRFMRLTGLDVDFSGALGAMGPADWVLGDSGEGAARKPGARPFRAMLRVPVRNDTARERSVRITWEEVGKGVSQAAKGHRAVLLKRGESARMELLSAPVEELLPGRSTRVIPTKFPELVKMSVADEESGGTLAVGYVRPSAQSLGLAIVVERLYSRAAFSDPPEDVSLSVRADLDDGLLRHSLLEVRLQATGAGQPETRNQKPLLSSRRSARRAGRRRWCLRARTFPGARTRRGRC